jgi:hypothetical protein
MADQRILNAVRNNAEWCDVVCRAHGCDTTFYDELWINRGASPRFYPNAVTLTGPTPRQLALIDDLIANSPTHEWALKDSFASLDLAPRGFTMLFEAQWIHLPASRSIETPNASNLRWELIRTEAGLAQWETAWNEAGGGDPRSARIFLTPLLDNKEVVFVAGHHNDRVLAGAIGNLAGGVVGWSNWFATEPRNARDCAAGSLSAIGRAFPDLPIVGYEDGEALSVASSLGFESLGALRVWVFDGGKR